MMKHAEEGNKTTGADDEACRRREQKQERRGRKLERERERVPAYLPTKDAIASATRD